LDSPSPGSLRVAPEGGEDHQGSGTGDASQPVLEVFGELLDQGIIEDPMLMADIYKVRQTAINQMRSGKVKTVR